MTLFSQFLFTLWISLSFCEVKDISSNFHSKVGDVEFTMVKFYVGWCGHCKHLAPIYEKASELLQRKENVALAQVNCEDSHGKAVCSEHKIEGYPTVKLFINGTYAEDCGPFGTPEQIVKYIEKKTEPLSLELNTLAALTELTDKADDYYVIGFFSSSGSQLANSFFHAAKAKQSFVKFAHTYNPVLLEDTGYTDKIVIYQPKKLHSPLLEPITQIYDGKPVSLDIVEFISTKRHGYCGLRTKDNMAEFSHPLIVAYLNIDYERNQKVAHYVRNRLIKVAKSLEREYPELRFAISDKNAFLSDLMSLGVDTDDDESLKTVVVGIDANNRKYVMKDKFSEAAVQSFARSMMDGKLEPFIKSEPVKTSSEDGVQVLVGSNFEQLVANAEKDYFIKFYAPWCGHCKKLAPEFAKLADTLKDSPNIVIAKINAEANEYPPQFQISGFPTLYLVLKGQYSNPIKYEGARTVDAFIKFLAPKTTVPLVGYDRAGERVSKEEL